MLILWVGSFYQGSFLQPNSFDSEISSTILVPTRNEESNIGALLKNISGQSHSKFTVLIVDDHSDDRTLEFVNSSQIAQLESLSLAQDQLGKKAAITAGVNSSKSEWIITVDADVSLSKQWLSAMLTFTDKYDCVVGPVRLEYKSDLLQQLQYWDFLAMQGFTKAGLDSGLYSMGNGANLLFKKSDFERVGGYKGNEHIPSGDDYFLLDKFRDMNGLRIGYAFDSKAIITAQSAKSWKQLFQQRLRWGSKMNAMKSWWLKLVLGFVLLLNIGWIGLVVGHLISTAWIGVAILMLGKTLMDYLYFVYLSRFFGRKPDWTSFWLISILHPFFLFGLTMISLVRLPSNWKGREV